MNRATFRHRITSGLASVALCACALVPMQAAAQATDARAVADRDYPGTIQLDVDASDIARRIQRVRERIPVAPGPMTLWYPQWIPGNHAPTGPINQIAGLIIEGNGSRITWRRDPLDTYAFRLDVPEGVGELDIRFDYLSPTSSAQGRVAMTPRLMSLQWHRVLLYPAGFDARRIRIEPSLRVPDGWQSATSLERSADDAGAMRYAATDLMTLIDSPVYAGVHARRFELDAGRAPVHLNAFADSAEQLDATPAMLAAHRALVVQADRVFGPRPFAHYDFLLALSDTFSGIGLEHRQSSENGTYAEYLRGTSAWIDNDLLPHEYVHAWSGKFRRPESTWAPHFNQPADNSLLWVYEGQTQYWAVVLAARSGLWTREQARDVLANTVATANVQAGRAWRDLGDTVHQGIIDFNDAPQAAASWQRGYDFYAEGSLVWLAVDARLRALSGGKRTLDEFARRFHACASADAPVSRYAQNEIARVLEQLQPGNWSAFLDARLHGLDDTGIDDGLRATGWQVVYRDTPNAAYTDAESAGGFDDFRFSIGVRIDGEGVVTESLWDSPAWRAGIARDMRVVAVNGVAYGAEPLKRAITEAKTSARAIELLVRQADQYSTVRVEYRGGLRYPHLERIKGAPDRLAQILAPR